MNNQQDTIYKKLINYIDKKVDYVEHKTNQLKNSAPVRYGAYIANKTGEYIDKTENLAGNLADAGRDPLGGIVKGLKYVGSRYNDGRNSRKDDGATQDNLNRAEKIKEKTFQLTTLKEDRKLTFNYETKKLTELKLINKTLSESLELQKEIAHDVAMIRLTNLAKTMFDVFKKAGFIGAGGKGLLGGCCCDNILDTDADKKNKNKKNKNKKNKNAKPSKSNKLNKLTNGAKNLGKNAFRLAGRAALPLAAAMSVYDGFKGFTDDEAIAERLGVDPSEIGFTDRLTQGVSSVGAGLLNTGVGLANLFGADLKEVSANSLIDTFKSTFSGKNSDGSKKSILQRLVSATPLGMAASAIIDSNKAPTNTATPISKPSKSLDDIYNEAMAMKVSAYQVPTASKDKIAYYNKNKEFYDKNKIPYITDKNGNIIHVFDDSREFNAAIDEDNETASDGRIYQFAGVSYEDALKNEKRFHEYMRRSDNLEIVAEKYGINTDSFALDGKFKSMRSKLEKSLDAAEQSNSDSLNIPISSDKSSSSSKSTPTNLSPEIAELAYSSTAAKNGLLDHNYTEAAKIQDKLKAVYDNIVKPLKKFYGADKVHINSGFRSEPVNALVGGAERSQHKLGNAVDIRVDGVSPSQVARDVENGLIDGLSSSIYKIKYPTFTHFDLRNGNPTGQKKVQEGGSGEDGAGGNTNPTPIVSDSSTAVVSNSVTSSPVTNIPSTPSNNSNSVSKSTNTINASSNIPGKNSSNIISTSSESPSIMNNTTAPSSYVSYGMSNIEFYAIQREINDF